MCRSQRVGWFLVGLTAISAAMAWPGYLKAADQKGPAIWFSPQNPFGRSRHGWGNNDYADLFNPDASWRKVAEATEAFVLPTEFVIFGDHALLRSVVADLTQRRIGIALAGLMLTGHDGCGKGIEGYTGPRDIQTAARTIRDMHGVIKFVSMDEPLWFGHTYSGINGCRTPLPELASQVSRRISELRAVFPDAKVGESEPVGNTLGPAWIDKISEWLTVYEQVVGEPLAFLQADANWGRQEWQTQLIDLQKLLLSRNIPLGIFYNGIGTPTQSNLEWNRAALARANFIEHQLKIQPSQVIIGSWALLPDRILPEEDPASLSGLVKSYMASSTFQKN